MNKSPDVQIIMDCLSSLEKEDLVICHTIKHECLCPALNTGVDDASLVISSQRFYMFTFVFLLF